MNKQIFLSILIPFSLHCAEPEQLVTQFSQHTLEQWQKVSSNVISGGDASTSRVVKGLLKKRLSDIAHEKAIRKQAESFLANLEKEIYSYRKNGISQPEEILYQQLNKQINRENSYPQIGRTREQYLYPWPTEKLTQILNSLSSNQDLEDYQKEIYIGAFLTVYFDQIEKHNRTNNSNGSTNYSDYCTIV